jgi:uncharacterized 2Fe-2S/4Fe-4S cluster protein (DUF4445 family)
MHNGRKHRHLALDLGTTTLAGQLLSEDGAVLAMAQVANPQMAMGADILTRLQQAQAGEGRQLQHLVIQGLRKLVGQLLEDAGGTIDDIVSAAAAGNPGMSCLLLNLPVSSLLSPPYKLPFRQRAIIAVDEIDHGMPLALQLFPSITGFIGGDLVACLLALGSCAPATLLIDIGTNAELALWDGTRWWVTSAAAGPAFEGDNIGTGMILAAGAVTDVCLADDRLLLSVAEQNTPRGLCGSGLAALVAESKRGGLIDASGRILAADEVETNLGRYLQEISGSWAIRYYRGAKAELILTQQDVRNFQLAKGAVRAGVEVLLERSGIAAEEVARVLVTGALGSALPVDVLKRVALLPEPMLDKTSFIANGVLTGLRAYLTSADGRRHVTALMSRLKPFPLSGTPAFEKRFLAALEFC